MLFLVKAEYLIDALHDGCMNLMLDLIECWIVGVFVRSMDSKTASSLDRIA
jgi:hypothetical protein